MARPNYYQVRNERARAAGFKSYGEQRSSRRLGYHTAAEFHTARGSSFRLPPPAPPAAPVPEAREWEAAALDYAGRTGYYTEHRTGDAGAQILELLRAAAADDERVRAVIFDGDSMLGTTGDTRFGDGWTAGYIVDLVEQDYDGDFWSWIVTLDSSYGETGTGAVSVTVG